MTTSERDEIIEQCAKIADARTGDLLADHLPCAGHVIAVAHDIRMLKNKVEGKDGL